MYDFISSSSTCTYIECSKTFFKKSAIMHESQHSSSLYGITCFTNPTPLSSTAQSLYQICSYISPGNWREIIIPLLQMKRQFIHLLSLFLTHWSPYLSFSKLPSCQSPKTKLFFVESALPSRAHILEQSLEFVFFSLKVQIVNIRDLMFYKAKSKLLSRYL